MSTENIRNSDLFLDLMKDIDNLYMVVNNNLSQKFVEIREIYTNRYSLGVVVYNNNEYQSILSELKKLNSFNDSGLFWKMDSIDWGSSQTIWTQGWGSIKFKMKVTESEFYKRKHRLFKDKEFYDLKLDISVAPDLGICLWGDTDDFLKKAKIVTMGINKTVYFYLQDWDSKEEVTELSFVPKKSLCECGAHKVYGSSVDPFFHSRWCKLFVDKKI